jgi:transposase-like protein
VDLAKASQGMRESLVRKEQTEMKGKRYTTEEKIRILRQADGGGTILEVCREANISEVTFHRWKKQFGQMEGERSQEAEGAGA